MQTFRSPSVTVDRADGEGCAGGRVLALVALGDGSSATDADVVGSAGVPGSAPEPDRDGCVQPVEDIAVAMTTAATMSTRLGMLVHPISTRGPAVARGRSCTVAPRRNSSFAVV